MGLRLHRESAQVDPDLARFEGDEVADPARRGVVEPESHRAIVSTLERPPDHGAGNRTLGFLRSMFKK